jgi:hypothetical protein
MTDSDPKCIKFEHGRLLALCGLIGGVLIAILVPAIVLKLGATLTSQMQFILVIVSVSIGGLIALTAAFFGTVIPSSVPTNPETNKEQP